MDEAEYVRVCACEGATVACVAAARRWLKV